MSGNSCIVPPEGEIRLPRYGILIRHYGDGKTDSMPVDTEEQMETAINTLKVNTSSSLIRFEVYIRKETFIKEQIWSNTNG